MSEFCSLDCGDSEVETKRPGLTGGVRGDGGVPEGICEELQCCVDLQGDNSEVLMGGSRSEEAFGVKVIFLLQVGEVGKRNSKLSHCS